MAYKKEVVCTFVLLNLFYVLLLETPVFANHTINHFGYDHYSTKVSPPVPLMAGIQNERKKVVEPIYENVNWEFSVGGAFACTMCDSEFLGIRKPWWDFTLIAPLRDLFSHTNANERFQNKLLRSQYGQTGVFFFEYHSTSEIARTGELLSDNVLAILQDPNEFYTKYGNRYVSQRGLGGYYLIAYKIEFPSEEERLFIDENVGIPVHVALNSTSILTDEIVDVLHASHLDGAVTVGVHLVGGDPAHLENFVDSHLGYKTPKSMSCAFSELSKCLELYTRWGEYFSADDGIPSTRVNFDSDKPSQTHVISYSLRDYIYAGINASPPTDPDVLPLYQKQAEFGEISKQLAESYNMAQQQYERIEVLLTHFRSRMNDDEVNNFIQIRSELQDNLDQIANIGLSCVDLEDSCTTDFNNLHLYAVDYSDLQLTPLSNEEMQKRIEMEPKPQLQLRRGDSGGGLFGIFILIPLILMVSIWKFLKP